MISAKVPVRQKLPGETKIYQVDLSQFLVSGEALLDNDFTVEIFEQDAITLYERELAGVASLALTLRAADGKQTVQEWKVEDEMANVVVIVGRSDMAPAPQMLVPGTKLWDSTNKIVSVAVQGGEAGKDYMLLWKFRTTSLREEWEAMIVQVRPLC